MNHNTPLCPTCHQPLPVAQRDPRHLTGRELQICSYLADGLTGPQIAARLVIEVGTVKNHTHSILQKLGVENRAQAGAWYSNRYKAE